MFFDVLASEAFECRSNTLELVFLTVIVCLGLSVLLFFSDAKILSQKPPPWP